jgi:hypothetical protein
VGLLPERRGGLLRPDRRVLAVGGAGKTLPWLCGGLGSGSRPVAWGTSRTRVVLDLVPHGGALRGEWRQRVQFRADLTKSGTDLQERVG